MEITATRRIGDILLVWSKHLIAADTVPEMPEFGLEGDWGDANAARAGFIQSEFTVRRTEGPRLICLAFEAKTILSG